MSSHPPPRAERDPAGASEAARELGRGGDGVVALVHDAPLDRLVARKSLDPQAADAAAAAVERFTREARTHARLEHPHIAPVYAFGVDEDGAPWFTMRRLRGRGLDELLSGDVRERSPDALREHIEIFQKVCDAVAYAHSMGVVHRDLKPKNVMVGEFGEVYLVDWGSGMTVDGPRDPQGVVFGTLAYCAPEQARGDNAHIDERTDVFGLGAILYQILTHHPPYETNAEGKLGVRDLLRQAQHALVRPVEAVVAGEHAPQALARVAMKALALDPRERFASVEELKAELQRFSRSAWRFRTSYFSAGDEIVRQGERGDEAFIVLSGSCQVFKTDAHRCTILRTLGAGDVFGETAALTGMPRSASIRALSDVKVAVITLQDLREHLSLDSWSGRIVKTLADRFREVDERRTALERQLRLRDVEAALLAAIAHARGPLSEEAARAAGAQVDASAAEVEEAIAASARLALVGGASRDAPRTVALREPDAPPAPFSLHPLRRG